ncbi:MAG: hydroxyacid dehydrogenase [Rhodospirillaceae bacterium]|nr:hydroxyacid dehydrogenase [Rhodospirillaceae bacterium]HAA91425.1 hydroxyacid dehydrogenase [Rhodospirillaceae bacterium]
MAEMIRVPAEECRSLCVQAFERNGVPPENAARAAEQFILCDLLGIPTHGVLRLSHYIGRIQVGGVDPKGKITVDKKTPALAIIDGGNTVGTAVATRATEVAIEMAREAGVAFLSVKNSNHFGANASFGWLASNEGMILISGTNGSLTMAATGGKATVVGNNPIGYAAPRKNGKHFILDFALSVQSRGKIRRAAELGEPIPEGWGLDPDGKDTTDAAAVLQGFVLPFGGHKGYGLALAVDMLSGVLSGGSFAPHVKSQFFEADEPSGICHYFICIDPEKMIGLEAFQERLEEYCAWIGAQPAADPAIPVRVPGERAGEAYLENLEIGLLVDAEHHKRNQGLADGSVKGVIPKG